MAPKSGQKKYASAHDFPRAFGDRWALRAMPPMLMELLRHERVETTLRLFVGRSVQATADMVWDACEQSKLRAGIEKRDTSRDAKGFSENGPQGVNDATGGFPR